MPSKEFEMKDSKGSVMQFTPDSSRSWVVVNLDDDTRIPVIGWAVVAQGEVGPRVEPVMLGLEGWPEIERDPSFKGMELSLRPVRPEEWKGCAEEWLGLPDEERLP